MINTKHMAMNNDEKGAKKINTQQTPGMNGANTREQNCQIIK